MSDQTFTLDIVSADEQIFSGSVRFAIMPAIEGELGVYPQHTPLLTLIKPGVIQYQINDESDYEVIYVSGGILEIQPTVVTVLADSAIRGKNLDDAKAELAIKDAKDKIAKSADKIDFSKAQAELLQANAQKEALQKFRKKKNIATSQ